MTNEQIRAGNDIFNKLCQTIQWVILVAQMQSGKTGTFLFVAAEMFREKVVKQVIIMCGNSEKELKELCDKYRKSDGSYDCIIPGSGGKDSFFTSHILKEKYGMHPLTVTWAPHIYTEWGWRNFQKWIHAGHDNYLLTPNGRVHRLLTRLATEILYHPFQPFFFGQKILHREWRQN